MLPNWVRCYRGQVKPLPRLCPRVLRDALVIRSLRLGLEDGLRRRDENTLLLGSVPTNTRTLYTLTHAVGALIAIQTLDGVGSIFGIVPILVVKDRTPGTGRFMWLRDHLRPCWYRLPRAQQSVAWLIQHLGTSVLSGLVCCCSRCIALVRVPETLSELLRINSESETNPRRRKR